MSGMFQRACLVRSIGTLAVLALALGGCGAGNPSPKPLSQRTLVVKVIYAPGAGAPVDRYDVTISFDNDHFPGAGESFACAGNGLERIVGPSGWVSWTGHYPYDSADAASAAQLSCMYSGQGTSFTFAVDMPDRLQVLAPAAGTTIPLNATSSVSYTVTPEGASVHMIGSPAVDVPQQVPPDQQPGVDLGTRSGSGQFILAPSTLQKIRSGPGLLKLSSVRSHNLLISQVATSTCTYETAFTLQVIWR